MTRLTLRRKHERQHRRERWAHNEDLALTLAGISQRARERRQRKDGFRRQQMKRCREWMLDITPKSPYALQEQEQFLFVFPEGSDVTISDCCVDGVTLIMLRWRSLFEESHNLGSQSLPELTTETESGSEAC